MNFTLDFGEIDRARAAIVGGKGANLGELARIEGIRVPPGFCVTTDAFERVVAPAVRGQRDRLAGLKPDAVEAIRELGAEARRIIESIAMPDDVAGAIAAAHERHGAQAAYAIRSSATAEDSPTMSFAGQHDSYLNVVGTAAVLERVTRCWASLFTERAIAYRLRNGIDHRKVRMAVVVQRMVSPEASGVLFTADPVSGNRKVTSIEATPGLGDALVSGLVNADVYKVRGGQTVSATKQGGRPLLDDLQIIRLADLGRRIESHFGRPQDVEWCLAANEFHFVQSRPITTLYPIPVRDDAENHVYLSVGHQQMMTDPLKPLAISVRELTAGTTFHEAGGRQFVDVTRMLASPVSRAGFLAMSAKSDPLTRDALETILARPDFIPSLPDAPPAMVAGIVPTPPIEADRSVVAGLIARSEASVEALRREIATKSGIELMDFILADFQELKRILFDPKSHQAFMTAMDATAWLNDHMEQWLGEKNAADVLTQSVPDNVTSEMGLALLDVADAIRPSPEVIAFLEGTANEQFLDELPRFPGGRDARDAIQSWLDRYGMRCVGEIDITRPRWSDRPTTLLPLILANVRNFEPGESRRRFTRGLAEAARKEKDLLERLRALPEGDVRAEETKRTIDRVRTFIGYREYPKFGMVSRYFIYRQALVREAGRLVEAGVLREADDVFWLTFSEVREVVASPRSRHPEGTEGPALRLGMLIRDRKDAFRWYQTLTPPRVLTSEGECIDGAYRRDVPAGALAGLAVSAGTVEGRARVILDMAGADLAPGDILVTTYTDPSWTPLFVAIAGLVTEVGGLMTHGAVIAREYGLPAVVGVAGATRLIRDGERVRVNGTDGIVEILPPAAP